jgi:preprotein translocase subunit SecF
MVNSAINDTLSRTVITSLTTLFSVIVLLVLGQAAIFDFALAMAIGIVIGTYSSIFVGSAILVEAQKKQQPNTKK